MTVYERVRRLCNSQGIEISNLGDYLPDANVSRSTISGWKNGAKPRAGIVKSIADYFDVSPEYIANGAQGNSAKSAEVKKATDAHAPVVVINGNEKKLSEQEVELLKLFRELDVIQKARLLAYAAEL